MELTFAVKDPLAGEWRIHHGSYIATVAAWLLALGLLVIGLLRGEALVILGGALFAVISVIGGVYLSLLAHRAARLHRQELSAALLLLERARSARAGLERTIEGLAHPPAEETLGPFSIACHSEHAAERCGGDWWSISRLPQRRVLVVIGDVTGHGLPAALIAAQARGAVAALGVSGGPPITPRRALKAVHTAIQRDNRGEFQSTGFAMVLDPVGRSVEFANASHCFPYVLSPDDPSSLGVIVARGNPLGGSELRIAEGRRKLRPGEVFFLHSDGVPDRLAAETGRCGNAQLRKLLRDKWRKMDSAGATNVRDVVRDRLDLACSEGQRPDDDLTVIVCEFVDGHATQRRAASRCRIVETAPGRFSILEEDKARAQAPAHREVSAGSAALRKCG